jgi:hypothetical protein
MLAGRVVFGREPVRRGLLAEIFTTPTVRTSSGVIYF